MTDCAAGAATLRTPVTTTRSLPKDTEVGAVVALVWLPALVLLALVLLKEPGPLVLVIPELTVVAFVTLPLEPTP
jgi:hypothetical protein